MACHGDRRDKCDRCERCDTCDRFSDSSTDRTGKLDDLSLSRRIVSRRHKRRPESSKVTECDYMSSMYMSWVVA